MTYRGRFSYGSFYNEWDVLTGWRPDLQLQGGVFGMKGVVGAEGNENVIKWHAVIFQPIII